MATLEEIKKHYWACEECIHSAGGTTNNMLGATLLKDAVCGVCDTKKDKTIPWLDADWPNVKISPYLHRD